MQLQSLHSGSSSAYTHNIWVKCYSFSGGIPVYILLLTIENSITSIMLQACKSNTFIKIHKKIPVQCIAVRIKIKFLFIIKLDGMIGDGQTDNKHVYRNTNAHAIRIKLYRWMSDHILPQVTRNSYDIFSYRLSAITWRNDRK